MVPIRIILAGTGPPATGANTATVTAMLDGMEARGLVKWIRDTGDRRRVLVEVTPEALERAAVYYVDLAEGAAALYDRYTTDELRAVFDLLRRGSEMLAEHMVRVKARLESEQPSTPDPAPEASP